MGCVAAAARAAVVVVATWLALIVLMFVLGSLLPGPGAQGTYSSTAVMLWLLALLVGPLVACVALRRWIAVGRAGSADEPLPPGPYVRAEQDTLQSGGPARRADASSPPQAYEQMTFPIPQAPADPDAAARRQAAAEAELKRAEAERVRKEEARRRAARNRRLREKHRRY